MKQRALLGATFAGLVGLVAVALAVFQFGRENPSPPSLQDNPNPAIPGELLYRDKENCLVRAKASGESFEQVYCGEPSPGTGKGSGAAIWIDERTIGFVIHSTTTPERADIVEVDLETREETVRTNVANVSIIWDQGALSPEGETAQIDEHGTLVITKSGNRTEVTDFDVNEPYRLRVSGWSPDGQWLVLSYTPPRDNANELWIVSRDGAVRGTLVKLEGNNFYGPSGRTSWLIPGVGVTPSLAQFP